MSEKTTLCLVNCSGQDITNIKVTQQTGFENSTNGPSSFLKGALAKDRSLCGYVELDADTCKYTVELSFGKENLVFTDDQHLAKDKNVGIITHSGSAPNLEVWRSSGGNVGDDSHGTNGIYIRSLPQPDHSGWMHALQTAKPDVTLNQLIMPGSHDAGMYTTEDYNLGGGGEWAQTQSLSILGQLQAGSRYFDLRICKHKDHLRTYHGDTGYGAYGAMLGSIIGDVKTFLQSAPGMNEVVILKFSHSYKDSVERTVGVVKNLGNLLYKHPAQTLTINLATMKLSDLAGKVVAVFGDEYSDHWNPDEGIFPYYDTDSNPSVVKHNALTVYDQYANDGTYEEMENDQNNKLKQYAGWGQKFLFLLSWTVTGGGDVSDIRVLAGMANPWLPKKLGNIWKLYHNQPSFDHRPNIAYIDFIDPYLCRAIIDLNR